jgi:hypothetical protein
VPRPARPARCDTAPCIGEHNEALLKPLLGEAEYDKLCRSGAIGGKKK